MKLKRQYLTVNEYWNAFLNRYEIWLFCPGDAHSCLIAVRHA